MKKAPLLLLTILLIVFYSCEKDDEKEIKEPELDFMEYDSNEGEIGSGGGIISTSDGVIIEVPPNALSNNTTISITNATEDTVINGGCYIFDLGPDGLSFSDSVTITFPFDDTYLNLSNQKENHGIFIMEYRDSLWVKLETNINLNEKTASAKTTHFSYYYIFFPWKWSKYFEENKNKPEVHYRVPYYHQGNSLWCSYYSLSMITKHAGYNIKGATYASMFGERRYDAFLSGYSVYNDLGTSGKLEDLDLSTEYAFPWWTDIEELSGYLLKKLDEGFPVMVSSGSVKHSFVVTGHNPDGFIINDPSGALFVKAFGYPGINHLVNVSVSYEEFKEALFKWWLENPLFLSGIGMIAGSESTLVITNENSEHIPSVTLNFPPEEDVFNIADQNGNVIGQLDINGKYDPMGYSLVNNASGDNQFNGSDYFKIYSVLANAEESTVNTKLHFKIDGIDIIEADLKVIPANISYWGRFQEFQLKNLFKGNHILSVELRSENSQIIYDAWDFPFTINNEYFPSEITHPVVTTLDATDVTNSSFTIGGMINDNGGGDITKKGFYFSNYNDPVNTGSEILVGSGDDPFDYDFDGYPANFTSYYVAFAENSAGRSFGVEKSVTTLTGDPPIADFIGEPRTVTEGGSVQFTDQSTNAPTSWSWDFGDGETSQDENPSHVYNTFGVYTVNLNVTNTDGSDQETKANYITVRNDVDGTVTDFDGNVYNTVIIGNQEWMQENLKTTHYADGTPILYVEDESSWGDLRISDRAYCWYDNSTANRDVYGGLYTWAAAMNGANSSDANPSGVQGVCPDGWHLPSDAEWKELEIYLGMSQSEVDNTDWRGVNVGSQLKESGNSHWQFPNNDATNTSGFTALPGGARESTGVFLRVSYYGYFLSATETDILFVWRRCLGYGNSSVSRSGHMKDMGQSVRCIRD